MRKNIKNYTTSIPVTKTVMQIEEMVVAKMKARQFFKDYKDGEITGVVFIIPTDNGDRAFKLPARVEQVMKMVKNPDQAKRTAWRNIHDWIDAQIALIETEQVKAEEIFFTIYGTKRRQNII
jgi:hypothetical protein